MQWERKEYLLLAVNIGKKIGGKVGYFLKGHLDSFKHANLISQAPEYI